MRRLLLFTFVAVVLMLGIRPQPAQAVIVSFPEMVCESIKANHLRKFKKITKVYRLKVIHFYKDSACEGVGLVRYALTHNSQQVGVYIVRQLPTKALKQIGTDGLTLSEWIVQHGLQETPIASSIRAQLSK